jgi:solute carrier family 25 iron transporter 28/37
LILSKYVFKIIQTHIQSSKSISSITSAILSLYQSGGFFRFWNGVSVIAAGSVPAHAAYFSVYELAKKRFGVENSGFQFFSSALTGAIATFFHDMILTPSDSKFK